MISKMPADLTKAFEGYLGENERVLESLKEVFILNYNFSWVVLTDKRIIISTKKILEYSFKDFYLNKVDIDLDLGFFFDELQIDVSGKKYQAQFYSFRRENTVKFYHKVNEAIAEQREGEPNQKPCPPLESLRELRKLLDEKVITKKEFEEKKQEILKEM